MRSLCTVLFPVMCCLLYLGQGFQLPVRIHRSAAFKTTTSFTSSAGHRLSRQLERTPASSRHFLFGDTYNNGPETNRAGPSNPLVDEMLAMLLKNMDPKMITSFMFPGDETKRNTYLGKMVGDVFLSSFVGSSETLDNNNGPVPAFTPQPLYFSPSSSSEPSSTLLEATAVMEPAVKKVYTTFTEDKPKKKKLPLPFLNIESIGIGGGWQEKEGNFVLFPPKEVAPKAIIHFLGGPFVGAAPHLSYKYMLESLSEKGFIIVATPYRLEFDYLQVCDGIIQKFDPLRKFLLNDLDLKLPIIGMGHSGGALLHTYLSALFPDYSYKSANILISFNNRPASHAIPAFHELIVPLSKQIMTERRFNQTASSFNFMRKYISTAIDLYSESYISPTFFSDEILPLFRQGMEIIDQVPPLMQVIANGKDQFTPTPQHAKEVVRLMYRIPHTLLVQFKADSLDETDNIEKIFGEANTIMRMKLNRTLEQMDVKKFVVDRSHNTPLTQNLLADLNQIALTVKVPETYNKLRNRFQHSYIDTVNDVNNAITKYLSELMEVDPKMRVPSTIVSDYKPRDISAVPQEGGDSNPYLPGEKENVISLNPANGSNKRKMLFRFGRKTAGSNDTTSADPSSEYEVQSLQTRRRGPIAAVRTFARSMSLRLKSSASRLFLRAPVVISIAGDAVPSLSKKTFVFVKESILLATALLKFVLTKALTLSGGVFNFLMMPLIVLKRQLAAVNWLAQCYNLVQHAIIVAFLFLMPL